MSIYTLLTAFLIPFVGINLASFVRDEKVRLLICLLFVLPTILILSNRDLSFGVDTSNYLKAFNSLKLSEPFNSNNFEPMYNILIYITKSLGLGFNFLQFIVLLIIFLCFLFAFSVFGRNFQYAFLLLLVSPFTILLTTNIQRQGLSVAFMTLALVLFHKDKRGWLVFMVLAVMSHISSAAFILLFLPFIYLNKRINKPVIVGGMGAIVYFLFITLILIIVDLIVPYFPDLRILDKFSRNIDEFIVDPDSSTKVGFSFLIDFLLLISVLLVLHTEKARGFFRKEYHDASFLCLLTFLGLSFYFSFSDMGVIARVAFYVWPFLVLLSILSISSFVEKYQTFLIANILIAFSIMKTIYTVSSA